MVPVGREAAFGVTADAGQCSDNSQYGSWFSLPTAGQCQDPNQPMSIAGNCTWRIIVRRLRSDSKLFSTLFLPQERVKTIDGKCLLQTQGMLASCLKETKLPVTNTLKIFSQAFASSDPNQGGCPDVA